MHGSSARALKHGIDPIKPKYSNWREYIAEPGRVFPVVWKDLESLNATVTDKAVEQKS